MPTHFLSMFRFQTRRKTSFREFFSETLHRDLLWMKSSIMISLIMGQVDPFQRLCLSHSLLVHLLVNILSNSCLILLVKILIMGLTKLLCSNRDLKAQLQLMLWLKGCHLVQLLHPTLTYYLRDQEQSQVLAEFQ